MKKEFLYIAVLFLFLPIIIISCKKDDNYVVEIPPEKITDFIGLEKLTTVCHRGLNAYNCPENSIHAITMAYAQGFKIVECDVKFTSDNVPVIMHDASINRTMNTIEDKDISSSAKVNVSSLTWEELSTKYIYKTSVPEYKTRVTSFYEWIQRVGELDLIPFLHNVSPSLIPTVQEYVGDKFIWMGSNLSSIMTVRTLAPGCFIMYQNAPEEDRKKGVISNIDGIIKKMKRFGGMVGYSSMTYKSFSDEFIEALTENGFYWQYSTTRPNYSSDAVRRGVDFLLTNNWCNNKLTYRTVYQQDDSLAYDSGKTVSIPFTTIGNNVKVIVTLKGKVTMTMDGIKSTFGHTDDMLKTYEFGINTLKQDLNLSVKCNTGVVISSLKIQESY